jgi:hypothetical protein
MDFPTSLHVLRCLVRDTFRQSVASRAFWLILGLSGLGILLCASVRIEGATASTPAGEIELFGGDRQPFTGLNAGEGYLSVGFGAVRLRLFRDGESAVVFLQTLLARWLAGAVGMLLVLLWSCGFLPEFLQPDAAVVLLAKPVPRWAVLAGKYLGVLVFVTAQVVLFIGGTWLALGLRTGFWPGGYLWSIPLLVVEFAILYSAAALLAVWTRRTALCLIGLVLFWALCSSVNYRHLARPAGEPPRGAAALGEAAYWVLPKPTDIVLLLGEVLQAGLHFQEPPELRLAMQGNRYRPDVSLLTSLVAAALIVGWAGHRLGRSEY